MKDIEKRLENIYKGIEKFLSLQQELQNNNNKLRAENQELTNKIAILEQHLTKTREESLAALSVTNNNNSQNKQEINNKIDELLSEVEQCRTLLKR